MAAIRNFEPREYQTAIVNTCREKNTLVCLPTGTGKTKVAILLAIERMNLYPDSKTLVCSPTRPLASQICDEFKESTDIEPALINLLTGVLKPSERKKFWDVSKVLVATPQTIMNDAAKGRISLKDVSLLCIDECHRSKHRYANTVVAKAYQEQAANSRVIALTASPGATREKIDEIVKNLAIESVEIRTEKDEDINPYMQEKNIQYIKIDLPEEFNQIIQNVKAVYTEKISDLKKFGLYKPVYAINKKDILILQNRLRMEILSGNRAAFSGISTVAQALKLSYIMELVETQSISFACEFLEKLSLEKTKAAKQILDNSKVKHAISKLAKLKEKGIEHPKLEKLKEIVKEKLSADPSTKIMVFANYRNTVSLIERQLKEIVNARPAVLVGQKEGLTQKKQLETIKNFEEGTSNVLIGTSITEEGINISGGANIAIFYDMVPSEIRKIQRMGRVGRTKKGEIIFLIAKKTRDEAFYWSSQRKENAMRNMLYSMKAKNEKKEEQKRLA